MWSVSANMDTFAPTPKKSRLLSVSLFGVPLVTACSRDGTAKLWHCGSGTCIGDIGARGGGVNGLALGWLGGQSAAGEVQPSGDGEMEVGTTGRLIALAGEDSLLSGHDIRQRETVSK